VLEDLDVQGLIQKSENKKRRMRLYDSSFSELRRCLEWVFQKQGKTVLAVSAYNTSRECFLCGGINKGLTLEDRIFNCPHCGFTLDRDLNACSPKKSRVGATRCACGTPPTTSSTLSWVEDARWGNDSGSSARRG